MLRIFSAALLTVFVVACNSPTDEDYDDVAVATAALITDEGGDVDAMQDSVETATGLPPRFYSRSGDGSWVGSRGQIDYSFDFTCRDAAGEVQEDCNDQTDEASLMVAWSGEVNTARRFAVLERSGTWTLSSLTSSIAAFNGTGQFSVDSEFQALFRPVMRSFSLDYQANYNNVQLDRALRRPVGGSIQYQVSAARTESRRFREVDSSFDMDVNVTFEPDGTATMVLDGDRRYTVTLSNGEVVPDAE